MTGRLRTALIGFGKMGWGYAADPLMARHYRYAAHSQVLVDHPAFDWTAVVDPDPAALSGVPDALALRTAQSAASLQNASEIEVAIIATPPDARLAVIEQLPCLRAVLVEKPLGKTMEQAEAFLTACERRGIIVQVNLWRRADDRFRELASGGLQALVGKPQFAIGIYGNGLLNNGTHAVDFARMLFGEVVSAQRLAGPQPFAEGPIEGDLNPAFALGLGCDLSVAFHPVRFSKYRENGFSIWGEIGRLDIMNEGLTLHHFSRGGNRAMTGEREIACDQPVKIESTVGTALYRMYDNLADAVGGSALWSDGRSALRTSAVVEAVRHAPPDGSIVPVVL